MFFHSFKFHHQALSSEKKARIHSNSIDSLLLDDDNSLRKTSLDEYMQAIQLFSNNIADPSNQQVNKVNIAIPMKKLVFSEKIEENVSINYISFVYKGLQYIKNCLKEPMNKSLAHKFVNLEEKEKTIFFDLDETLIHACGIAENPQFIFPALTEDNEGGLLGINVRPFCIETLHTLSKYFDIYIFTASSDNYANSVIDFLDPQNKYIKGVLSRKNCLSTKSGFFIKDLRIIKNIDLKKVVIVDNMPHSFGFQLENGIPILEWKNDPTDEELKLLTKYLLEGLKEDDLRLYNRKKFHLAEIIDKDDFHPDLI